MFDSFKDEVLKRNNDVYEALVDENQIELYYSFDFGDIYKEYEILDINLNREKTIFDSTNAIVKNIEMDDFTFFAYFVRDVLVNLQNLEFNSPLLKFNLKYSRKINTISSLAGSSNDSIYLSIGEIDHADLEIQKEFFFNEEDNLYLNHFLENLNELEEKISKSKKESKNLVSIYDNIYNSVEFKKFFVYINLMKMVNLEFEFIHITNLGVKNFTISLKDLMEYYNDLDEEDLLPMSEKEYKKYRVKNSFM